ncbi:uncharacterized protein BCR38DRAFT_413505 [Pseudomassariella vexata]|uniref:Uncharacterized protein n=1 Tax=Pseudomassariella vexata TaxID=1141098 RepID=A0A1Y2DH76_9PEZI|nr:uncharacterized protein BCR38DRAFT_413505 [Pseudomassariella vexata]ORY58095.1 hypothetical protein BCR38DRAFT_413505 [Pseudomassariella vexata]
MTPQVYPPEYEEGVAKAPSTPADSTKNISLSVPRFINTLEVISSLLVDSKTQFASSLTGWMHLAVFNKDKISAYIHNNFKKDEYYLELDDRDRQGGIIIQGSVVTFNGVLLWVFLVLGYVHNQVAKQEDTNEKVVQALPYFLSVVERCVLLEDPQKRIRNLVMRVPTIEV